MGTPLAPSPVRPVGSGPDVLRSWVSLAMLPLAFFGAIAVGEALTVGLGYRIGDNNPAWVSVLVDSVATAIILVPCAAAVLFARRAVRVGVRAARVPMALGALLGTAVLLLTVITEIGNAVR